MNRYTVLEQLGDGAFGVVFKAEQKNTGEIVAIKRMKQRFVTWEECLQLREIISLRRLQHANVIKLKEVVRENAELCMVFEFMEQNIYQIMKSRTSARGHSLCVFDEREIRSIITQTLLGIQAIHKGGFMHRDLKPENLLTKGDLVKIADFGLAKEIRCRPPFTEYVSTRWYRAPEIVLRSDRYNSPIDIWALGVIMVELYLNRPLFPGASDTDQLFKICSILGAPTPAEWDEGHQLARRLNLRFPNISPTPLRQLLSNTNASPAALDLLEGMLRFNPSERPTASQCLQHPFITGSDQAGGAFGVTANLFMGICTGAAHNPFHIAANVPTPLPNNPGAGATTASTGFAAGMPGSSGSTVAPGAQGYRDRGGSPSPGGSPTPGTQPAHGLPIGGHGGYGGTATGAYATTSAQGVSNAAGGRYTGPQGYTGGYFGTSTVGSAQPTGAPPAPTSPYTTGAQYGGAPTPGGGYTATTTAAGAVGGSAYGGGGGGASYRGAQQAQQQPYGATSAAYGTQPAVGGAGRTGNSMFGAEQYTGGGGANGAGGGSYHHQRTTSGGGHHFGSAGPLDEY